MTGAGNAQSVGSVSGIGESLAVSQSGWPSIGAKSNFYRPESVPGMTSGESQLNSNVYTTQVSWFIMREDPYLWRPGRKYDRPTLIKKRLGIPDMVLYYLYNLFDQYLMVHRQRTVECVKAKEGCGYANERLCTSSRLPRVSKPSMNRVARIAVNLKGVRASQVGTGGSKSGANIKQKFSYATCAKESRRSIHRQKGGSGSADTDLAKGRTSSWKGDLSKCGTLKSYGPGGTPNLEGQHLNTASSGKIKMEKSVEECL
ncbi:hypothetical protein DFH09DRAFT_1080542 [Mycena vulgaris]|nr:hypothetical protein DFH09DRAFT_1080542 [Mycena vulgaris]